ncbi:MAG TPA: DUF2085 domain-containing protein [Roseiflexaceae bacterium]|nr:DUF2085 domain-containing protein [Roseiflexaceae bacterium]
MLSHPLDNLRSVPAPARSWPTWPLKTVLAVLFLGPIIAPLFQATGLPLIADSGWLARDILSTYICPTPAKSYMLAGHSMAVCARCWGATIGLWVAWFAVQKNKEYAKNKKQKTNSILVHSGLFTALCSLFLLAWPLRLALAALPFALWVLEINYWPAAPLGVLLINGALAGFSAGLFVCSIWPGLLATHAPASLTQA